MHAEILLTRVVFRIFMMPQAKRLRKIFLITMQIYELFPTGKIA